MDTVKVKPKLIFFRTKWDQTLPEFLLIHEREHVKCLSESFAVTVINANCDYQYVCDKYEPDITLFESGINISTCQKLTITNTHAHPKIPKLGFVNADAWCETRSGTLSEMDHWGIETLFAISTTAPEHAPDIADRLFIWPNFIDSDLYKDYGESKLIPVLLTGAISAQYPWRRRIYKLLSGYYPSLTCPHRGYLDRSLTRQVMYGEEYARAINASLVSPACGTVAKELVRKHLEIPACNTCLITESSAILKSAGFVDMHNCVFADEHTVLEKVAYLFQHPEELQAISAAGHQLIHSRHTLKQRDQILQWFDLHKASRPADRIVQPSPFDALTVLSRSSNSAPTHCVSSGLHLTLLRQGDERLWAGKYNEAETAYLGCLRYMRRLPEAKLHLALCKLYRGDGEAASELILEPILYTLTEYKAMDPDPVEWAWYIISLLCLGRRAAANECASEFSWVRHPELDRTRWMIGALKDGANSAVPLEDLQVKQRSSIHDLPIRSNREWFEEVCKVLKACGQLEAADALRKCAIHGAPGRHEREFRTLASRQLPSTKGSANQGTEEDRMFVSVTRKRLLGSFNRRVIYHTFVRKMRNIASRGVQFFEAAVRHCWPLSAMRTERRNFASAIHDLARKKEMKTALIVGATAVKGSTKALLTGALKKHNRLTVMCLGNSAERPLPRDKRIVSHHIVKWYKLSLSPSPKSSVVELKQTIRNIKIENQLDVFDVVLIDGSEIDYSAIEDAFIEEVSAAKFVLLDNVGEESTNKSYRRLAGAATHVLVDRHCELVDGCAIFARADSE